MERKKPAVTQSLPLSIAKPDGNRSDERENNAQKAGDAQNEASIGEIDDALLEKLRKLRNEIAVKEAVPAYIVFSNSSLSEMCRKKPVSLVQFSGINGVGRVKLEKYGEKFTNLIREYCQK